ncbi:putative leucine-rich repeat extensin-like protein 3 [Iris pallida]|uniref:Leucine-rich repeat extensin-like protein 3 n=1 Tax=Iris pallida TaxID=29817 RepID=A0AAX6G225_IRIPA|nr:putative leucine-rich repeat extensin-like protein 3 [Iris pallida]
METPLLLELENLNFTSDLKAIWTFAALVLAAIFATRSRALLLLLPRIFLSGKSVISRPSSSSDASFSYSDDDDDDNSSSDDDGSDDEDEDDDHNEETTPPLSSSYNIYEEEEEEEEEFQGQYGNYDRVVKFWDEAFRSGPPPSSSVLTAEEEAETGGHLAVVRLWDARSPEVVATWRAEGEAVAAGFGRREERVHVMDGTGRVTVVDLRNVRSALGESWRPERPSCPGEGDGIGKEDKLMVV